MLLFSSSSVGWTNLSVSLPCGSFLSHVPHAGHFQNANLTRWTICTQLSKDCHHRYSLQTAKQWWSTTTVAALLFPLKLKGCYDIRYDNHAANGSRLVHLLEVSHMALHGCELSLGRPLERDILVDQQGFGVRGHQVVDGAFRHCPHKHQRDRRNQVWLQKDKHYRRYSKTVILWPYKPSLWPWPWSKHTNLSTWHSVSWWCAIIPSLVTKGSVVQEISSRQAVTDILTFAVVLALNNHFLLTRHSSSWWCTIK